MDLSEYLHRLLAPRRVGDEIVAGVRWSGVSTELGLLLRFDVRGESLGISIGPLPGTSRYAARSERLAFSYRTEGGRQTIDPALGRRICEAVADLARANELEVMQALQRDAAQHTESPATRVRHVQVTRLLEPAGLGDERYYTLSPYVGCLIGCRFCYAGPKLATVRAWMGLPAVPWGSYVDVRSNAPEVLRTELMSLDPRPIKFCPIVADPYQAVERRESITRACLEVIRDATQVWPALLLTRSALIVRDAELLASLPACFAGVSLPTVDEHVRRHFEPRAASIDERLDVLRTLRRHGVSTFAVVQPLLPGSIDALADRLAETVTSVSIDVLRGEQDARADFDDPRHAHSRDPAWQHARAEELREHLHRRGVSVWSTELPPDLRVPSAT